MSAHDCVRWMSALFILVVSPLAVGKNVKVPTVSIIDKDTSYSNVTLDLDGGSFQIINHATLKIENSQIKGSINTGRPSLFTLVNGTLILNKNKVNIDSSAIAAQPQNPALYYAINVSQGSVTLSSNEFTNNKDYTIGLLTTTRVATNNIQIINNDISHFHGGLLLINSKHAFISRNKFSHVSSSNIFIMDSSDNAVIGNTILFSGNNNIGDGIDISDSANVTVDKNYISFGSCYSLMVLRGKNISINNNKILSGITYAIFIESSIGTNGIGNQYLQKFMGKQAENQGNNQNVVITNNYISQNRYGLAVNHVDGLIVKNNYFIQKYTDAGSRKFWTNNDILLKNTVNIAWENNLYKEAYSQDPNDDNKYAGKIVSFPLRGGVIL